MSVIAAVTTFCFAISTIYNHCKYPTNLANKTQKLTITLSITSYAIAMIITCISYIIIDSGLCWAYILFISRMFSTFKDSAFHSSKLIYLTLYLGVIIFIVCHLIFITMRLLEYTESISNETESTIHLIQLIVKCTS